MKKYNVNVNGKTYQIEIEEVQNFDPKQAPAAPAAGLLRRPPPPAGGAGSPAAASPGVSVPPAHVRSVPPPPASAEPAGPPDGRRLPSPAPPAIPASPAPDTWSSPPFLVNGSISICRPALVTARSAEADLKLSVILAHLNVKINTLSVNLQK